MDKVVIIGPSSKFLSGITYYTINIANLLRTNKKIIVFEIDQLLPRFLFPGSKRVGKVKINSTYKKEVSISKIKIKYYSFLSIIKTAKAINLIKPKVIIFQWWSCTVAHIYYLLIKFISKKIKIIFEFHEILDVSEASFYPLKVYSNLMLKLLLRNVTVFITHSISDKQKVIKAYKIDSAKIQVVPHLTTTTYSLIDKNEARNRLNLPNNSIVLVYFGLIRKYKGVNLLVKAFDQLEISSLEKPLLVVAGEIWDPLEKRTYEIINKNENIILIDKYLTDKEIESLISVADCFILPYTRASQSGVLSIIHNTGKPVILSNINEFKEASKNYFNSIFFKKNDIANLKSKIEFFVKNHKDFNTKPDNNHEMVKELFLSFI
ncbi:MAG: glycosyltransferase [Candidatus Heimdallarchaeum endolithica]|uniref:Glycosyltransferase n=1 Tax=Candidatus Heimdallarchaeum endolithica TaxID=2876572 RepID=A0A9Y1BSY5_9ARCH|nr:MAG: glycosyltransferase [Candidatus Heimdallarchaeum endolithica]